jgi:hypothetical protein
MASNENYEEETRRYGSMKGSIRFSDPVDCGERTIIPIIRDISIVSPFGGMVVRDPLGLVIMEHKQAWFVALDDEVTESIVDELLGIKD